MMLCTSLLFPTKISFIPLFEPEPALRAFDALIPNDAETLLARLEPRLQQPQSS
jgi:hypothetical protein